MSYEGAASVAKNPAQFFALDGLSNFHDHNESLDYQEYLPEMEATYSCPLSTVMEQPEYSHQKQIHPLATSSLSTSFPTRITDHMDYSPFLHLPIASSLESSSSYLNVHTGGISDSQSYSSSYGPSLSPPSSPFNTGIQTSMDPPSTIIEEDELGSLHIRQPNGLSYEENLTSAWKNDLAGESSNPSFPEVPIKEESEPLAYYDNEDYCPSSQLYREEDLYSSTAFPSSDAIEPIQEAMSNEFVTLPSSPPHPEGPYAPISPDKLTLQIAICEPSLTDISTPDTPANVSPVSPFAPLTKVEPVSPVKPSFAFQNLPNLSINTRSLEPQVSLAGEVLQPENQTLSSIRTLQLDNQQNDFPDIFQKKDSSIPFSKDNSRNCSSENKEISTIYNRQDEQNQELNCFISSENNHKEAFHAVQQPLVGASEALLPVKQEPLDTQDMHFVRPLLTPKPHMKITENNGCKTSRKQSSRICRIPPETMASLYRGPEEDGKFICLFNGCCKRVRRKYNIESHIQTHLSDRPYRCEVCKAGFVRHHDLKRHLRIHENGRPYVCECSKRFNRLDALNRHKQRNICIGGLNRR
ncbi:transcription factor Ace2 [Schizosaccharomyces cryophilus OY26]|uniref:Transcription factor Ace2 n=1 Tax=Schizosaccharomyces cryophilus (strain OY26 / ATCC MYA-4695 / CBS 11777 / NBRC 106824 / NRRL Y48691) TaxID=653667 RepID=S9X507_SCHCR|nr:transcription factor Ace2 [Schizosaccharomyces cryophilus OY26]EPY52167.1 transcription factor Ace2 [Schizosaccharomyces cryophilus OY26]